MVRNIIKAMTTPRARSVQATSSFLVFLLLFAFTGPTWACLKMGQRDGTESKTSAVSCHSTNAKKASDTSSTKDCPFCSSSSCFTNALPTNANASLDESNSSQVTKNFVKSEPLRDTTHNLSFNAKINPLNQKRPPSNWQAVFSVFII